MFFMKKKNVLSLIGILNCLLILFSCASTKGISMTKAGKQLEAGDFSELDVVIHVEDDNELRSLAEKLKALGADKSVKLTLTCGESVNTISNGTFKDCKSLVSIVIPSGIKSIRDEAFANCVNLKSVTVPAGLNLISETAFIGCNNLKFIKDEKGKTVKNNNISSVINNTKYLSASDFASVISKADKKEFDINVYVKDDGELKKVAAAVKALPEGTSIKLNLASSSGVKSFDTGLFSDCKSLVHISIPDSVDTIGSGVFTGCDNLVSLKFPRSLKNIDKYAFIDCVNLKNFSGLKDGNLLLKNNNVLIGYYSMDGAVDLLQKHESGELALRIYISDSFDLIDLVSEINGLPLDATVSLELLCDDSIEVFEKDCFANCRNLTSIIVKGNIKAVEAKAFKGCVNLVYVELPDTVEVIDFRAFMGCSLLEEFIAPEKAKKALQNRKVLASYIDVSKAVERLAALTNGELKMNVFVSDNDELTMLALKIKGLPKEARVDLSLIFSENVTTIKTGTFEGCVSLTGIIIPEGVTSIENKAFKDCINLVSVELPNSMKAMDYRAFLGCINLGPLNVPKNARESLNNRPILYNYLDITKTQEKLIASMNEEDLILRVYIEDASELAMLASIVKALNDKSPSPFINLEISCSDKLSVIAKETFKGCEKLVRIVIPEGIVSIEERAFQNCVNLKNVIMPGSTENVDYRAFLGCESLETIDEPENPFKIKKL